MPLKAKTWGPKPGSNSNPFLFLTVICNSEIFNKWTRGESNPCPKAYSPRFLPSQSVFFHSLCTTPTDRLSVSVASYFYFRLKALPKEFPTWMTPVTGVNPCGTSRLLLLRSGLRRSDVLHVRQQMLIRYYQRLYLVIRLLR